MDMGTMEKTDMARVMTPIMTPPVCSVTQQQHCRNRGISGHTPRVCNHILYHGQQICLDMMHE